MPSRTGLYYLTLRILDLNLLVAWTPAASASTLNPITYTLHHYSSHPPHVPAHAVDLGGDGLGGVLGAGVVDDNVAAAAFWVGSGLRAQGSGLRAQGFGLLWR